MCLLIVAGDGTVARWAAKPLDLGGSNRFMPLVLETRVAQASIAELDAIGERLLTAQTLQEALGSH